MEQFYQNIDFDNVNAGVQLVKDYETACGDTRMHDEDLLSQCPSLYEEYRAMVMKKNELLDGGETQVALDAKLERGDEKGKPAKLSALRFEAFPSSWKPQMLENRFRGNIVKSEECRATVMKKDELLDGGGTQVVLDTKLERGDEKGKPAKLSALRFEAFPSSWKPQKLENKSCGDIVNGGQFEKSQTFSSTCPPKCNPNTCHHKALEISEASKPFTDFVAQKHRDKDSESLLLDSMQLSPASLPDLLRSEARISARSQDGLVQTDERLESDENLVTIFPLLDSTKSLPLMELPSQSNDCSKCFCATIIDNSARSLALKRLSAKTTCELQSNKNPSRMQCVRNKSKNLKSEKSLGGNARTKRLSGYFNVVNENALLNIEARFNEELGEMFGIVNELDGLKVDRKKDNWRYSSE